MIYTKNSAKAIIVIEQKILILKKQYEDGQQTYTLPGGTQEPGETLEQAVIREVYEETAATISVLDLHHIYEHKRLSKKEQGVIKHKVEFAFICLLEGPYSPTMGAYPDPHQVAVEWVNINSLHKLTLSPAKLSEILTTPALSGRKTYLGDITA